jgi:predicted DNA-binding transcriptional regulator AlpA
VNRRPREEGASPSVRHEILTTDEVCTLLKIKKAMLYRHTSQGTGPPFYKIGKHNRWKLLTDALHEDDGGVHRDGVFAVYSRYERAPPTWSAGPLFLCCRGVVQVVAVVLTLL